MTNTSQQKYSLPGCFKIHACIPNPARLQKNHCTIRSGLSYKCNIYGLAYWNALQLIMKSLVLRNQIMAVLIWRFYWLTFYRHLCLGSSLSCSNDTWVEIQVLNRKSNLHLPPWYKKNSHNSCFNVVVLVYNSRHAAKMCLIGNTVTWMDTPVVSNGGTSPWF